MATDITGSQIVYHHCGTPMPGEVSPKRMSSHTMRVLRTAIRVNSRNTVMAPKRAKARWRAREPLSAKNSMRIWRLRATEAEPATSASTIIRNTENSSVQAKDWLVK